MRRLSVVLAAAVLLLAIGSCVSTAHKVRTVELPDDLDGYLATKEGSVPGVLPGVRKEILWAGERGARTPVSIVYLHGWQGSRREYAAVFDTVARELGANLYYTRLRGYGVTTEEIAQVRLQDWIDDTVEALEIGRRIGERVIVAGSSMGGDLALWLAARRPDSVAGVVLLSCAVEPADKRSGMLLWPWPLRNLILSIASGRWNDTALRAELYPTGSAELVQRYNPPRYRSVSTIRLMSVVKLVREVPVDDIVVPTLWLYSERDDAVDIPTMKDFYRRTGGAKSMIAVQDARAHMLAGDLFQPETTPVVIEAILGFLRGIDLAAVRD